MNEASAFDLQRFVQAQEPVYRSVVQELAAGAKCSHWMWFVFPQLKGLGRSETARQILGSPDDLKFCSSMTLFERIAPEEPAFAQALEYYFGGRRDKLTLELLG